MLLEHANGALVVLLEILLHCYSDRTLFLQQVYQNAELNTYYVQSQSTCHCMAFLILKIATFLTNEDVTTLLHLCRRFNYVHLIVLYFSLTQQDCFL